MLSSVGSPRVWVLSPQCQHPPSKVLHPKRIPVLPIAPGLHAPLHIPAATSVQAGPSSLPAGSLQPLPLLPTPCHHHRASEPGKDENPLEKQVPNPTSPPTPYSHARSASGDCPHCRDLLPDPLLPARTPVPRGWTCTSWDHRFCLHPGSCTLCCCLVGEH